MTSQERNSLSAAGDHQGCPKWKSLGEASGVPGRVLGPNGDLLKSSDLPSGNTTRWVIRRKAEIVAAVRGQLLSLEEACRRYMLTVDEFRAWENSIERHGVMALKATRLQLYRKSAVRFNQAEKPGRSHPLSDQSSNDLRRHGRDWLFLGS
jgi:Protein of unknown function (DUF1153)